MQTWYFKIYVMRTSLYAPETWTRTKKSGWKNWSHGDYFFREIISKTKKERIRNTDMKFKLGAEKITNTFKRKD